MTLEALLSPPDLDPHRPRPGRPRVADDPIERAKHIRCAIRRLCDRKSIAQVAEEMGISPRTVRYWTSLALTYVNEPEHRHLKTRANRRGRRDRFDADLY